MVCCCCRGKRCAVVALLLTMNLFEAMNGTLLGLLIPVVAAEFEVSTEVAAWIQLGPSFTSSMLGPSIGMVADTIGRTGTWRVFAGVLMVSLPICGFAPDIFTLVLARTFGGMSWAGCGPAGFAIMAEGLEASKRGVVSAWQQSIAMLGASTGTALGGILISVMGWRWVFLLAMFPITAVWLLSFCILPKDDDMSRAELRTRMKTFDTKGTWLFIVCCGAVMLVINRGNDLGWTSPTVLISLGVALVSAPLLVATERRAAQPILPIALFTADPIAIKCLLLSSGTWTAYMGNFVVLPIFLQMARGFTTAEAGLFLFTRPCGGMLVSSLLSRYMGSEKARLNWVMRAGSLAMTLAFVAMYFLAHVIEDREQLRALVMAVLLLQAGGGNGVSIPAQAVLVARMPASRLASITSIMQMIGGVASMTGSVAMLSAMRAGDRVETEATSYRIVWAACAAISVLVHALTWTMPARAQHGSATEEAEGGEGADGEQDSLLRGSAEDE